MTKRNMTPNNIIIVLILVWKRIGVYNAFYGRKVQWTKGRTQRLL